MADWGFTVNSPADILFTENTQAGTVMHELGHNFGLLHGGDENRSSKPNHLSVMNYMYSFRGIPPTRPASTPSSSLEAAMLARPASLFFLTSAGSRLCLSDPMKKLSETMSHPTRRMRHSLSTALLLAIASSGCATDPAGDDLDIDPDDTTAPAVASTEPAASASAVREDEKVHVTFSEPMDQASVEAAYASTDLPADAVSFEWNAESTVLTITPASPLAYAEGAGTDPSVVTAKTYTLTIGTGALDLAGNPLVTPMELSFSTRRRLLALFGLDLTLSRVTLATVSHAATEILVGDFTSTASYRSYLTFDMSSLPAGAEVEKAQFQGRQILIEGAPYNLGPVNVEHLTYTSTLATILNGLQATSAPGVFSTDATQENKTIDVTSQVIDDVANRVARNDRSQYRLRSAQPTNNDAVADRASFGKNTFVLGTIYVVD